MLVLLLLPCASGSSEDGVPASTASSGHQLSQQRFSGTAGDGAAVCASTLVVAPHAAVTSTKWTHWLV